MYKTIWVSSRTIWSCKFFIVDNNGFEEDRLDISTKFIRKAISKPVKNVIAAAWIANEMKKKRRT